MALVWHPLFEGDIFAAPNSQAVPLQRVAAHDWPAVREHLSSAHARWAQSHHFEARQAQVLHLPASNGGLARVLIGVGDTPAEASPSDGHGSVMWDFAELPKILPEGVYTLADADKVPAPQLEALALGWALGAIDSGVPSSRSSARFVLPAALQNRVIAMATATAWVRRLVNAPANLLGPVALSKEVQGLALRHSAQYEVWEGAALIEAGFPLVYAVGQAAAESPRVARLDWGDARHPRVVLVGKGVCFDSGGLDIKPAATMRWMKKDMGGAAHALALAELVMQAQLPLRLTLLIPAAENAVGAGALRPGDVIRSGKGLTVEIENTDAEGRLLLADVLHHGLSQPGADTALVIDLATLTGAARMALGPDLPALFSNDDALAESLIVSAHRQHDWLWRLPLWQPYQSLLKSSNADLLNAASIPQAGAITAALFLQHFVPASAPWLHLDLFAWNTESRPGRPKGGDAQGLRALFDLLEQKFPPRNAALSSTSL